MARPFALQKPGGVGYMTHGPFIPPTFKTPGVAHSANVKINGSFAHHVTNLSEVHCTPTKPPICDVESVVVGNTSTSVFINGQPAAFIGANTVPGGVILDFASLTVFAGS